MLQAVKGCVDVGETLMHSAGIRFELVAEGRVQVGHRVQVPAQLSQRCFPLSHGSVPPVNQRLSI